MGIAIAASLAIGHALNLKDHILEVPISAMLILQLGTDTAAADRFVETIIGAGVGLVAGLLTSPVRVQPAEEAIDGLGSHVAALLNDMGDDLRVEPDEKTAGQWVERAEQARDEVPPVQNALAEAEDSARFNPLARGIDLHDLALRDALEILEEAAVITHGLARSSADRTLLYLNDQSGLGAEMWEADVRLHLSAALHALARATRHYTDAATSTPAPSRPSSCSASWRARWPRAAANATPWAESCARTPATGRCTANSWSTWTVSWTACATSAAPPSSRPCASPPPCAVGPRTDGRPD